MNLEKISPYSLSNNKSSKVINFKELQWTPKYPSFSSINTEDHVYVNPDFNLKWRDFPEISRAVREDLYESFPFPSLEGGTASGILYLVDTKIDSKITLGI